MSPNVKILKLNILFVLTICLSNCSFAQDAYDINWNKQWKYIGIELGLNAISFGIYSITEPTDFEEWQSLDRTKIPSFDRISLSQSSAKAGTISDYIANGSFVFPVAMYLAKINDSAWRKSSIMYFDALALTGALVNISKYSFRRPRPYVYNLQLQEGDILSRSDRAAMISGHTTLTSTNSFFAAALFHRAYPNSKAVPFVYSAAAIVPMITAWKRVEAGKHFPSDVVAGYLVGMGISWAVIQVHKRDDLELQMGTSGAGLTFTF